VTTAKPHRATLFLHSVRAKLLLMLVTLSLPLLIVSLHQLRNYRSSLDTQAATIAHIETAAAAGALASWLEDHPSVAARSNTLTPIEARDLRQLLQKSMSPGAGTDVTIFDADGHNVPLSATDTLLSENVANLSGTTTSRVKWSDGVARITDWTNVDPFAWRVAVGVPVIENTVAGHSLVTLAVTWAAALLASTLLVVWAVGRFTKPLRQLAASASTLGEGKLQERVAVETDDEVGTLAEGFNVMAAHLEGKFAELQTESAFIEEVLDGLPVGVAVLDASLLVRKANPTFARFVGREPNSLKGRGIYEAAAGLAVLSEVIEDVRRTRKPFVTYSLPLGLIATRGDKEGEGKTESANNFWDITLWPTTKRSAERGDLIFVLSEVSKRVRAEKLATAAFSAERTRAAELESVINQMNEGVVIIDQQGRYRVNAAAKKIIGRQQSDLRDGVQALIADISLRDMDGREIPETETPLGRALWRRERIEGEQLKIIGNDNQTRVVAISATPLVGEDGKQQGAVAVFRDITESVEQHNELVSAYDRLREHDRLKSAFVSNMSHELRTPLNVISGLCQLLERDPQMPLAPSQNEAVGRMKRNARSLLELVNDLLDYSRLEAGRAALHLESIDVAEVVNSVATEHGDEIKDKSIELRVEIARDFGAVTTDKYKLSQVISNLVGNAIKFTSIGAITIAAGELDAERWYMEVRDTGIGMSHEALTYIFDEFRQVDDRLARSYGGTGLGLAITRRIVELLEGEITVESKPEEGSCFRITWPRVVRQRTGTGSLVEKSVPEPAASVTAHLRAISR